MFIYLRFYVFLVSALFFTLSSTLLAQAENDYPAESFEFGAELFDNTCIKERNAVYDNDAGPVVDAFKENGLTYQNAFSYHNPDLPASGWILMDMEHEIFDCAIVISNMVGHEDKLLRDLDKFEEELISKLNNESGVKTTSNSGFSIIDGDRAYTIGYQMPVEGENLEGINYLTIILMAKRN